MFSPLKALLFISLLIIAGCNLTGLDDTLTFSMETKQDNIYAVAISHSDTMSDTLLVLDKSGSVSASVSIGDSITVFVYVHDISGEMILYNKREFKIKEGEKVKYKI